MTITRRAILGGAAGAASVSFADDAVSWRSLASGLEHGLARIASDIGDGQLHVARIDPAHYRFRLLTGAATGASPRTARQWARQHNLVAAINAAMFRPDGLPVGYAKADGHVVQPSRNNDRTIFAFDETRARILDLSCESFEPDTEENALQGIRMIACDGRNVWSQQPRIWSIAALAEDEAGRLLFLHARSPLSVHDFIAYTQALPLQLSRAMYLEGGPEATLYLNAGGFELERYGSYETGFYESDGNDRAWPLPNVLGVVPRA